MQQQRRFIATDGSPRERLLRSDIYNEQPIEYSITRYQSKKISACDGYAAMSIWFRLGWRTL
jgi:hypothetical protein